MDLFFSKATNLFKSDSVKHDNGLFRLHHQVNYFVVLVGILFIFGQNHFGSAIKCYDTSDSYVDQYCWFHGSGHLPFDLSKKVSGCVAKQKLEGFEEGDQRHTRYYLWLPFTLGLCLAIIKTPRFIWKHCCEGGIMSSILDNETPKEMAARIKELKRDGARKYFLSFIFCEILNIFSIILCMVTLNILLGGNFWNYGTEVLQFYSDTETGRLDRKSLGQEELVNPMCNVFPTEVSCNVYSASANGEIEVKNKLCMLSNNIFNQYYFFVLWFWWVILLTLSLGFLVYRLIYLMVPSFPVAELKNLLSHQGFKPDKDSTYFFQDQKQWDAFLLKRVIGNLNRRNVKHLLDEMINQEIRNTNRIEKEQEALPLYETQIDMD